MHTLCLAFSHGHSSCILQDVAHGGDIARPGHPRLLSTAGSMPVDVARKALSWSFSVNARSYSTGFSTQCLLLFIIKCTTRQRLRSMLHNQRVHMSQLSSQAPPLEPLSPCVVHLHWLLRRRWRSPLALRSGIHPKQRVVHLNCPPNPVSYLLERT